MLVSGVRSSWLTIERKSSLIRCAACSRAIRSWRSDHSCAFWSAGPGPVGDGLRHARRIRSLGEAAGPPRAVASTPCSRPPARIGTASSQSRPSARMPSGSPGRDRVGARLPRGGGRRHRLRSGPRPDAAGRSAAKRSPALDELASSARRRPRDEPAIRLPDREQATVAHPGSARHRAATARSVGSRSSDAPKSRPSRLSSSRSRASRCCRAPPRRAAAWSRAFSVARPMTIRLKRPATRPTPMRYPTRTGSSWRRAGPVRAVAARPPGTCRHHDRRPDDGSEPEAQGRPEDDEAVEEVRVERVGAPRRRPS